MGGDAPILPFLDIVERLPDAVLVIGPDGTTLDYLAPTVSKVTGIPRDLLVSLWPVAWIDRFVHVDDRGVLGNHLFSSVVEIPEGHVRELEFRIAAMGAERAGELSQAWRWVNSRLWPRRRDGVLEGALCVLRDVTAEKVAFATMLESETRYAQLFDAIPEAVVVFDREDLRILDANATALHRYGYTREEIRALTFADVEVGGERLDGATPTVRIPVPGFPRSGVYKHRTRDGREFPVDIHLGPTRFEGRTAVLAAVVDTSERTRAEIEFQKLHDQIVEKSKQLETTLDRLRQTQAQLLQAQKMEAIGQLAGGIAHDFNNLLTAVIGTIEIVLLEMPIDSPFRKDLSTAEEAARQAAELTRRLVSLARQRPPEVRRLDPVEVIRAAASILRRTLPETIRFVEQIGQGLPSIQGDATQIQQAILNLGINARDAMPEGGTLTLEADVATMDETGFAHTSDGYAGPYLRIRVRDTGCGIDRATVERIFEPFFTTKGPGRGTGLGLSTVYATMRAHCGHVSVDSEPGRGSTFSLLLPTSAEYPATPAARPDVARGAGETILLVDDDPIVLQTARRSLESLGYRVLTAGSGAAAVSFLEESGDPLSLVLLDVVMPGMGGVAALRRIRALRPRMPAILMTGYGGPDFAPPSDLGAVMLRKPLDLAELSVTIRRALDEAAASAR